MQNNTENLQLSTIFSRIFAAIIDEILVSVIIMFIFWSNISSVANNTEEMMYLISVQIVPPLIMLKVVYHTFFVWYYGATVGKIFMKIRVIDANNWGKTTFFSSFLRAVTRVASEWFLYIGFLIAFFNDGRKTLHDFLGRTLVVNA